MRRSIYYTFLLLFGIVFWTSCGGDRDIPDVSEVEIDYELVRYDELILQADTTDILPYLENLYEEHPEFTQLYFSRVLPLRGDTIPELATSMKGFLADEGIRNLAEAVQNKFSDFSEIKREIHDALRYYSYYFPDDVVPDIYTFISEYAYQSFIFAKAEKDGVGIGLDLFLGEDYPYAQIDPKNPAFSAYLTRSFNAEHIPKKVVEQMLIDKLNGVAKDQLLDYMILNGKKLYIMDKLLPYTPDTVVIEMPKEKLDWLEANELEMWAFFLNEDLFYESESLKIGKFINPSPHSPGMPPEAPGRTANFIGWKIVEAYMNKNPQMSFQQLVDEKDAQKIMNESGYKPRKTSR